MSEPQWRRSFRLESDPRNEDPRPGAAAPLGDPMWLLGRQWWMGEMDFFDGGTPVSASITFGEDRFARATGQPVDPDRLIPSALLGSNNTTHWRDKLRLCQSLLAHAEQTGQAEALAQAIVDLGDSFILAPEHPILRRLKENRRIDGARVLAAVKEDKLDLPDRFLELARGWAVQQHVALDAFNADRRAHGLQLVTQASGHIGTSTAAGPELHWSDLGGEPATGQIKTLSKPLARASLPGQQPPRWWRYEDATLDWTAAPAGPSDLGQLLIAAAFAEQGQVQWRCEIETANNAIVLITKASVKDTFGLEREAEDGRTDALRGWSMAEGAFVLLARAPLLEGPLLEEASIRADAVDNLVWLEETTRRNDDGHGAPWRPRSEHRDLAEPVLALRVAPPENWIPYTLEDGSLVSTPLSVREGARIGQTQFAKSEFKIGQTEIGPRGIRFISRPMLGRAPSGHRHLWHVCYAQVADRAASSSGLRHDVVLRPTL